MVFQEGPLPGWGESLASGPLSHAQGQDVQAVLDVLFPEGEGPAALLRFFPCVQSHQGVEAIPADEHALRCRAGICRGMGAVPVEGYLLRHQAGVHQALEVVPDFPLPLLSRFLHCQHCGGEPGMEDVPEGEDFSGGQDAQLLQELLFFRRQMLITQVQSDAEAVLPAVWPIQVQGGERFVPTFTQLELVGSSGVWEQEG